MDALPRTPKIPELNIQQIYVNRKTEAKRLQIAVTAAQEVCRKSGSLRNQHKRNSAPKA